MLILLIAFWSLAIAATRAEIVASISDTTVALALIALPAELPEVAFAEKLPLIAGAKTVLTPVEPVEDRLPAT